MSTCGASFSSAARGLCIACVRPDFPGSIRDRGSLAFRSLQADNSYRKIQPRTDGA